jgi:peptidoglycan hydrolase-like protein with peptidoglycan-binding domain
MAQEGMGGTVLLGLTGIALGAFIVDYAFSEPGQSWYDQIAAKLKGTKPELPPALPPGPPAVTRPAVTPPMMPVPLPSVAVPYAPMPPASPEVIREVQARLNSFGFKGLAGVKMPLNVDGLLGPNTRRVLAAMQRQWQLPETAYPDADTLRTLRAMTARLAAAPPLAPPPVTYTPYPMPSAAPPMPSARRAVPRPPRATHPALGAAAPVAATPDAMAVAADLANRLGQFFQLTVPASSISHDDLAQLLSRFQQQMGLPATGLTDPHTIDVLRQMTATGPVRTGFYFTGAASWEDETASLGAAAQDVLRHAIASETDSRTLMSLGQMLTKAGFPLAAVAVNAKAGGPAAAAGWW